MKELSRLLSSVPGSVTLAVNDKANALKAAGDLMLSLGGQAFGTSTTGYASLFSGVREDIQSVLGGGVDNVINAQDRFVQAAHGTTQAVDDVRGAIDESGKSRDDLLDDQIKKLDGIIDAIDRLRDSSGVVVHGNGGSSGVR